MRLAYLIVAWFFFTVMLVLMVWRIVGDISWVLFFPALVSGVIGFMFAGASRAEREESHGRPE